MNNPVIIGAHSPSIKYKDRLTASTLIRTRETADIVTSSLGIELAPELNSSIREIDYGMYSGQPNNATLDDTRTKQSAGNYNIRFGETGESKFDIEVRLLVFIKELLIKHSPSDSVLVITHGSIVNWMDRIIAQIEGSAVDRKQIKNGDMLEYVINRIQIKKIKSMIEGLKIELPGCL